MSLSLVGFNTKAIIMYNICRYRSPSLLVACLFLLVTLSASNLYAKERPIKGKLVLPGEDCQTALPQESWTPQEKWVWKQVCQGKIADFNKAKDYGGALDPKEDKEWPENRVLKPAFLETILLNEPYRGALTRHGVRIVGTWFKEPLDLSNATLSHPLWLDSSRFELEVKLGSLKALKLLSLEASVFKGRVNLSGAEIRELNMIGSKFTAELNMNGMQVEGSLLMYGVAEFAEVDLIGAKIGGQISMIGSKFTAMLIMDSMQVEGSLLMREGAEFAEVDLRGAKIGGQVCMSGSQFTGKLNMDSMEVGSNVFMREGAEFAEVDLGSAKIGGQISMIGCKFTGKLNMNGMQVEGSLLMRKVPEFAEVDLRGAKIGGPLAMDGSKFTGKLNMNGMEVGSNLFMRDGAEFTEPLASTFAKIGKNLDLSGSTLASIDLTGTHVRGEFALGPPAPRWLEGAKLTLCNAEMGALQDLPWPDRLELDGFTYACLGGFAADDASRVGARKISRFKEWLEKQTRYSPQPYEQLATVLRKAGYKGKAKAILYKGKKREHWEATRMLSGTWWWLTLQWLFIGYGYRIYYAFFWCLGLILIGALILRLSGQGPAHGMPYGFSYSLDMLLPIIRLSEGHYKFDITGRARYYFYFHILMGYVLGSFLIAGLSGLIK